MALLTHKRIRYDFVMRVYRQKYVKVIPAGAKKPTRIPRNATTETRPDGSIVIRWKSPVWTCQYKDESGKMVTKSTGMRYKECAQQVVCNLAPKQLCRAVPKPPPCCKLYVMGWGSSKAVKVGMTSKDVESRRMALQAGSLCKINVLALFKIRSIRDERKAHRLLKQFLVRREIFRHPDGRNAIIKLIQSLGYEQLPLSVSRRGVNYYGPVPISTPPIVTEKRVDARHASGILSCAESPVPTG